MYTLVRKSCLCGLVLMLLSLGVATRAGAQGLTITSPQNMGTWSVGVVDGQLLSAINGTSQTYTWTIVSGALPPGLSLRTDLPSWVNSQNNPNVSAAIIGVATTPGIFNFTLRVTNNGVSTDQPASMTISTLLLKDNFQLPDAYTVAGQPYSYTLSAFRSDSGPVTPTWSIPNWSNPWPAGLSLNSATGEISGQATQPGFFNLTVGITQGGETVYRSININVANIRFTSSLSLSNGLQGSPYNGLVTAEGGTGTKTFTASGLPSGLSISSGGAITGTTSNFGVFVVNVTATDQNSTSYTRSHSLTIVGNPKQLPSVLPYNSAIDDCTLGWPCNRGVSVFGGTAPFTWSASGLPPGISIRQGATAGATPFYPPTDLEIWGTPAAMGTYNVTIQVTDSEGATATNTFPLKISELAVMNAPVTWTKDVGPTTQVLRIIGGPTTPANFATATDGTLNYTGTALSGAAPAGVSFFGSGPPRFSGTPVENVFTNVRVQYTSTSSAAQITNSYFFGVGNGNSTIQINTNSNLGTSQIGTTPSVTFTACCPSSGLTWSLFSGTLPAGMALNSSTGVLSGPLSGSPGTYTFVIQAAQGANVGRKAFTFYAASNNLTSGSTLPYGNVGVQYSTTLVTSNGGTWTLNPFQYLPPGLQLVNGTVISGMPTQSGRYTFQMTNSSSAGTLSVFFTLSIYPAGQAPPIVWNPTSFGNNLGSLTRELPVPSGGTGTGYAYSYSPGATIIPGVRVQTGGPFPTNFSGATTGALLGVVTQPGVYNTSLRVTDSGGNTVDRPITVSVLGMLVMQQSTLPPAIKSVFYSYQLTQTGGTAPTWSVTGLPAGLGVNSTTGVISGTTTAVGSFNLSIGLSENGQFASYGYSLQVNASDISFDLANSRVLPSGTQNVLYSQVTFSAPACGTGCTYTANGLPGGLTINSSTGVVSGTPNATFNGGFGITATGSNGSSTKRFSIQILTPTPQVLQISNLAATQSFTVGSTAAVALTGAGGVPPYNWTIDSGTLPDGITLQGPGENLGGSLNPGFMYLAGRMTIASTRTFTVRVTDSSTPQQTSTRQITWGTKGLASSYSSLPGNGSQIPSGVPFTTNNRLLVLGGSALAGTGNYTFGHTTALPFGLQLNSNTGEVTGTPTETGSTTVTFTATDTATQETLSFNVTISVSGGLIMNFGLGSNLGTVAVGNVINNDLSISGGIQPWTVTAVTPLPDGYVILTGDGTFNQPPYNTAGPGAWFLSGTPTKPGIYEFTLQVQDSAATPNVRQKTFFLTVLGFNFLGNTNLPDASLGEPYSYVASTTGVIGTPTFSITPGSSLPPGLALNGNVLSGTPTVASGTLQGGGYTFQLDLRDSAVPGLVRTAQYTLRVGSVRITDPQFLTMVGVAGTPFNYAFTATGANVTWSATQIPGGYFFSSSGVLSNPEPSAGAFSITVTATPLNGGVPATRRFAFYVRQQNPSVLDFPYAGTKFADVTANQQIFISLNGISGGLPPYSWTVAPGSSLPAGLSLLGGAQLSSPIMNSFLVAPAVLTGSIATPGTYTFDLIVHDSLGAQARRTFTLKVSALGIVSGTVRNGVANQGYGQRFTPFGGTGPYTFSYSPISLVRDTLPPGLNFTTSGVITGTPTSTGVYQFSLQVQDSQNNTFTRVVTYTIANANGWYVNNTNPNDATLGTGRRSSMSLSTGFLAAPPPTVTWSLLSGTPPPGVSVLTGPPWVDENEGAIAGQPTDVGTYTFTVRATDVGNPNNFADHAFKMRTAPMQMVAPPVEAAVAPDLPAGHVGAFYSTTLKAAGGKPPYTFTVSPFNLLPTGLNLNSATGEISGTPQFIGSTTFTPIITDANGRVLNSNPLLLVVTAAGTPAPLSFISDAGDLPGGSLNVPFSFPLDLALRGGMPPFTWNVSNGSTLPPGMTLLPNSNSVSTYFAGVPTEPNGGGFKFSLDAHDSSGQTVTIEYDFNVTASALTPDTIRPGRVGVPYSAQITPTGGVAPYSLAVYPAFDMPPGLTLNSAGLLSGTPTTAGNFPIVLFLTDSAGDENAFGYRIAIDNAAGEAPAVSLTPTPIQVFHTTGSPSPAPIQVAVASTSSAFQYGLSIAGIPGASVSNGAGSAPDTINLNLDLSGIAEGTYHGVLGVRAGAVNLIDQVPVTVIVAPPPPCTYSIAPASGSVVANGGSGTFDLSTGANCSWTAVSNASWLNVDSVPSGAGSTTIAFTAAANPDTTPRLGTITVQNQVFTLTQFSAQACSFALSPPTVSAPSAGGVAIVSVTASAPACSWPASSSATLGLAPSTTVGSGTVTVTVPVNGVEPIGRQLTATIAGLPFIVNQGGYNCTAALTPYEAGASAGGGAGSVTVTVTPGCSYDTIVGPSWVSITSGGSGAQSGTLVYDVQPNSTTLPRMGTLTIGGQSFTITQEGVACSVTVDTSTLGSPYGPSAGGVGSVAVTANGSNCSWVASSGSLWASLSPTGGSGNGTVSVFVMSNAAATTPRTTDLTVAGQVISITQAGTACTYGLQSQGASVPAGGASGSVGVLTPSVCSWGAVSNAPSWLTAGKPSDTGSKPLPFSVLPNSSSSPRVGTLTVTGTSGNPAVMTFTVSQAGAACSFTLDSAGNSVGEGSVQGLTFGFHTAVSGCAAPSPTSYAGWLTVTNNSFDGTNGLVQYSVAANASGAPRSGTIQVGGKSFLVTQAGSACSYTLNAYGSAFGQAGGNGTILAGASAGCTTTPPAGSSEPFIDVGTVIPPPPLFSIPFTVQQYISLNPAIRLGTVTFGGQVHTVKQTSW